MKGASKIARVGIGVVSAAWAELHQEELMADWQLLLAGRRPAPIQPLS